MMSVGAFEAGGVIGCLVAGVLADLVMQKVADI